MNVLTDEQIQQIFRSIASERNYFPHLDVATLNFIVCYANAVCNATRRDFMIMRPTSLILIVKYHLGSLLEEQRSA